MKEAIEKAAKVWCYRTSDGCAASCDAHGECRGNRWLGYKTDICAALATFLRAWEPSVAVVQAGIDADDVIGSEYCKRVLLAMAAAEAEEIEKCSG